MPEVLSLLREALDCYEVMLGGRLSDLSHHASNVLVDFVGMFVHTSRYILDFYFNVKLEILNAG